MGGWETEGEDSGVNSETGLRSPGSPHASSWRAGRCWGRGGRVRAAFRFLRVTCLFSLLRYLSLRLLAGPTAITQCSSHGDQRGSRSSPHWMHFTFSWW